MKDKQTRYQYRQDRTRDRLSARPDGRPRLSVHRTLRYVYAQVIDDASGKTLAAASSLSKELRGPKGKAVKNVGAARKVGELVARKALEAGVKKVAFDRGAYLYHGRVKALAEAARAVGLEF